MTAASEATLEVLANPRAMAEHVAAGLLERALAKQGAFAVCLSGGETPKRLHEVLADPPCRGRFPGTRTHWFWGDSARRQCHTTKWWKDVISRALVGTP